MSWWDRDDLLELDQGLPERVFDTSLFLGVLLTLCSTSLGSLEITLGLAAGVVISLAFCQVLWWSIRHFIRPGVRGQKSVFLAIGIIKYAALTAALFVMFRYFNVHVLAFFVGLSTVQTVIILKLLSLMLVDFLNRYIRPANTRQQAGYPFNQKSAVGNSND